MFTFPKNEKLCGKLRIAALYQEGRRFVSFPLRVTYKPIDGETQVLIWAPKSLFKHAVDRNRVRRLIREAYRLEKAAYASREEHFQLAFNYMDKEIRSEEQIRKAVRKALAKVYAL